jgi:aquaporin Z
MEAVGRTFHGFLGKAPWFGALVTVGWRRPTTIDRAPRGINDRPFPSHVPPAYIPRVRSSHALADLSQGGVVNKYVTELVGTFFLVLTIGCTVVGGGAGVIPPLAIAAALMVMVYAGGHISGAHYNPAVTLAVVMRGKCASKDMLPYILFQLAGAALAAVVVKFLFPAAAPVPATLDVGRALLAEFLFTFALAYVVLNVATAGATSGNSFYGLAIGFTVLAGAFAVGGVSGGAFNPAVAVGAALMGLLDVTTIWIHIAGNFAGAAVAALAFKALNPGDVA